MNKVVRPRRRTLRASRVTGRSTSPSARTVDERKTGKTSHVLSKSKAGKKTWVRPKNFGRRPDGSGPGRKKGQTNKVTREIKAAIQLRGQELVDRLFELAFGYDRHVAHAACKTLLLYGYGRPTIHVEIDGSKKRAYITEMPKDVSHEEWLEMMKATYGRTVIDVTSTAVHAEMKAESNGDLASTNGSLNGSFNGNGNHG